MNSTILQNIILGISLAAPIGPANIAVIKKGLNKGFISGFLVGVGVVTADTFYLLLIYFGLSNFLNIPILQTVIWVLGSVVLLYMGYKSIKEYFVTTTLDELKPSQRNSFAEGFIINLSNPLAIVWWTGVFGSALAEALKKSAARFEVLLNSLTIVVGLLLWVFTVALLTHWGKKFLNEKSIKYISLIAGCLLLGFGLKFGYNAVLALANLKL